MRSVPQPRLAIVCAAAVAALASSHNLNAAVLYSTGGSTYSQNFDSLPSSPENASIEATAPWQDDTAPGAGYTSIPGWYLWHPLDPGAEDGANEHQRLRIGTGSSNTGSFWSFGATGSGERALGVVGSTTIATNPTVTPPAVATPDIYIGLRLTNNTGYTLDSFTLSYTGEQWRNGGTTNGVSETMLFDYSLTAAGISEANNAQYTAVSALNWTSPVNSTTAAAVNGNVEGKVPVAAVTVNNIAWLPGTDLWLRWNDPQISGNDHGMAIDDVSFSAVPEPASLSMVGIGAAVALRRRRK